LIIILGAALLFVGIIIFIIYIRRLKTRINEG
jgi:hypothetical protein